MKLKFAFSVNMINISEVAMKRKCSAFKLKRQQHMITET